MFSNRRVLVTGGAGFIGSHLCERLLARGDEVLCVDNFFTATRPNVSDLMSNSRFELVRHDVCFSNRPFGVKHFQTIHLCGVDVARGLALLFGIGTKALVWGFLSQAG